MTQLDNGFYYNTRKSFNTIYVRVYRKRVNPRWWQERYEYMADDIYLQKYDGSPHDLAVKIVAKIENEFGGLSQSQWAKSLADKTMRKV